MRAQRFLASQIDPRCQVVKELLEFTGFELLRGIAEGIDRVGMGFDNQAIGADREAGASEGRDQTARTGGVRGVDDDGQVRELLGHGYRPKVQEIARTGVE